MAHTIVSKVNGPFVYNEYKAHVASMLPGMLVQKAAALEVEPHSTEGGDGELMVAIEDALQGNGQTDAYTIAMPVRCWTPRAGDEFWGILENGQNVADGAQLISAGNGKFKASAAAGSGVTVAKVFAVAAQAQDLTVSGSADTLTLMRAL